MRILVTGPESSGTKMVAAILIKAGADVVHDTPRWCIDDQFQDGENYDYVVLVIRTGYCTARSMCDNQHAYDGSDSDNRRDLTLAYRMVPEALWSILHFIKDHTKVRVVTYEALVHETEGALGGLLDDLGLSKDFDFDPICDANAKYYGGKSFHDDRLLEDRI
jgi:hypothetical protein